MPRSLRSSWVASLAGLGSLHAKVCTSHAHGLGRPASRNQQCHRGLLVFEGKGFQAQCCCGVRWAGSHSSSVCSRR